MVDLRDVAASAGLKLRELWRRNRQGDLSVPGFWPISLASLFWPLLLTAGLAVVLALVLSVARGVGSAPAPATPSASPSQPQAQSELQQPLQSSLPQPVQAPVQPSPPQPTLELDPLLALLAQDDPDGWIASARPVPAEGRLDLQLADAFLALPPQRRQQQADHWLQRSRELGYDRLRLMDAGGNLLGQAARVGNGMVLLEPLGLPQA